MRVCFQPQGRRNGNIREMNSDFMNIHIYPYCRCCLAGEACVVRKGKDLDASEYAVE
jgi:hypothetical protein